MPFTMLCGHFFRSLLMFAPPPQPQSSTLASGVSSKKRSPHRATGLCPRFIMATIIFPPKPTGLRVFSKNDISHLQILHTRHRSEETRLSGQHFAAQGRTGDHTIIKIVSARHSVRTANGFFSFHDSSFVFPSLHDRFRSHFFKISTIFAKSSFAS